MKKILATVFALGFAVMLLPSAWAQTPILAGGSDSPVPSGAFSGTLENTLTGTLNNGLGINATFTEYVYLSGGDYDFYFQVTNSSTGDNLDQVTLTNYAGFTTAVGAFVGPSTEVDPSAVNRTSGTGNAVNFLFLNGSDQNTLGSQSPGGAGDVSYWLEINTNATSYGLVGGISVTDTLSALTAAYAPTPEPVTTGIVGGALALMALVVRRRSAKKA